MKNNNLAEPQRREERQKNIVFFNYFILFSAFSARKVFLFFESFLCVSAAPRELVF